MIKIFSLFLGTHPFAASSFKIRLEVDKDNDPIQELYIKFLRNTISDGELAELKTWVSASPANKQDLWEFCRAYHALDAYHTLLRTDSEKAFSTIREKIAPAEKKIRHFTYFQRVAAVLFLPLVALSLYLWLQKQEQGSFATSYATNPGMIAQITLPDSSTVWLNADSKLEVSANFAHNRKVKLDGEAYFDVKKDKAHTFQVQTPQGTHVEVLGTRFNVDAYKNNKTVRATLEEGAIAFTFQQQGARKKLILSPGQSVVYDVETQDIIPNRLDPETLIAWKDNRMVLRNTSMEELSTLLFKRFDVKIILKSPSLTQERFTGELHTQTLQSVLEYLKISSGIDYHIVESLDQHTIVELSRK